MAITLRSTKGSALTHTEMDDNFEEIEGTFSSSVTLSGQTTSITGIPSGINHLEVHLWGAFNHNADTGFRLGTSSGYVTSYNAQGGHYLYRNSVQWREFDQTAIWAYDNLANTYWGRIVCTRILSTGHKWHVFANLVDTDAIFLQMGAVDLGASLDRVQITNPSWGSHTAGTMQVRYKV